MPVDLVPEENFTNTDLQLLHKEKISPTFLCLLLSNLLSEVGREGKECKQL